MSRKRKKQYQELLDTNIAEIMTELETERVKYLNLISSSYTAAVNDLIQTSINNPNADITYDLDLFKDELQEENNRIESEKEYI